GEVVCQFGLRLDPAEVETPLVDKRAHDVVRADLPFQGRWCQLVSVVVDAGSVALEPGAGVCDARLLYGVGPAYKLPLIDLFDVDAELAEPAVCVRYCG